MKKLIGKHVMVPPLVLVLALLVSCMPAATRAEPTLPSPTSSGVVEQSLTTSTQTGTSTGTLSPTVTSTLIPSVTSPPSATQSLVLLPGATVHATSTRKVRRRNTPTASQTPTSTPPATRTPPATVTRCPLPTAEPFYVWPVTSPTDQLSQIITASIGNGESITVITESGTFTAAGRYAQIEITLLPNTVHHLQVIGKVKKVIVKGCVYGGYSLQTTRDSRGNPLIIVQETPVPYP